MKTKILVVGIILLFVAIAYAPAIAQNTEKQLVSRGTWLYVGGSGPGNYSRIQDAIDNASGGDTIFVYNESSPYKEDIKIRKSITLIGENKSTTVILGYTNGIVINISADDVSISGFTIQPLLIYYTAIGVNYHYIYPDYWNTKLIENVTIYDNIIKNASNGIIGCRFNHGKIYRNIIKNCFDGIRLEISSSNNTISQNIITHCKHRGIIIFGLWNILILENYQMIIHHLNPKPENNNISRNTIKSNGLGIMLYRGPINTKIFENNIIDNSEFGIIITNAVNTEITRNNFINNYKNAHFTVDKLRFSQFLISKQAWNQNYWGEPKKLPVGIPGSFSIEIFPRVPISFIIEHFNFPLITFDKNPAQEPYDIPGMR
ncbi:MAG: right-handed parallel beta-helix repeat-containing protein [Candidatus Thermoplasmatota archaeon]|nr:right-handed parallel beta-helix repeat-containing protein [Candidatus Thermoplasmatota archaeon]